MDISLRANRGADGPEHKFGEGLVAALPHGGSGPTVFHAKVVVRRSVSEAPELGKNSLAFLKFGKINQIFSAYFGKVLEVRLRLRCEWETNGEIGACRLAIQHVEI